MQPLLLDLPEQIITPRLSWRPYRAGDGPAYFDVCQRNRDQLPPFERGNPALNVQTVEDAEMLVRHFAADWAASGRRSSSARGTGKAAHSWPELPVGPVNWDARDSQWLLRGRRSAEERARLRDRGRAPEALLGWLFGTAGAPGAAGIQRGQHARRRACGRRCGFTLEGHLRQTRPHPLQPGAWSGDLNIRAAAPRV